MGGFVKSALDLYSKYGYIFPGYKDGQGKHLSRQQFFCLSVFCLETLTLLLTS